jgi:two-component system sensor histidine kinase ChvG
MRSIRWKIMLTAFFIVFLPIYSLNRYAVKSFDRFTSKALEEEMISHAFMFGEQYKTMVLGLGESRIKDMRTEFAELLRLYGPQLHSHLRVLSPRGIVLFDSDMDSTVGADLSGCTEIVKAMRGRYGARWRVTDDRKYVYYYSALPLLHENTLVGIAYVVRHTSQITGAIKIMLHDQRFAMVMSILFGALLSAVLAQTMTRRLRRLTQASIEYARGHAPLDLNIKGEDEIGDLGRAVTYMAEEIERRNEYNRDFVSTIMHEMKTPVTAIKGAAEVLEGGAVDKKDARKKFLGNIRYEADRLTRMVGELSELTKLDVETLRGQKEKVDYCTCIREILDRIIPTFDEDRATFTASIPGDAIPTMVMPGRIEQVVANLLENAFRYTPTTGHVKLVVSRDGRDVLTCVKDTGPGITAGSAYRIFERFYTTEPKGVPKEYGSGLGLAVAKSIVENHHGRIWATSDPGEGATFTFSLPILKS